MSDARILTGLAVTTFGVAALLDQADGGSNALQVLVHWWPLSLVALGLVNLFRLIERRWAVAGPLLAVFVGTVLLLHTVSGERSKQLYTLLWPTMFILLGLWIAMAGAERGNHSLVPSNEIRDVVWLRGRYLRSSVPFRRASITVLFGALELDLRHAQLEPTTAINLNVLCGTVHVLVAQSVRYEVLRPFVLRARGLDEDQLDTSTEPLHLRIHALALFGDISVRVTKKTSGGTPPAIS
jgi:hypothetical protein